MTATDERGRGSDLAKVHALDTLTTQGRTDGRTRTGLASPDNELDELLLRQRVLGHGGMRMGSGGVWAEDGRFSSGDTPRPDWPVPSESALSTETSSSLRIQLLSTAQAPPIDPAYCF